MKINGKTIIAEILNYDDRCEQVFEKFGLKCNECSGAVSETIDEAAIGHCIDVEKLKEELAELIEQIEKEKSAK